MVRPPLIRSIQVSRERCPQLHGLGKRYGAPDTGHASPATVAEPAPPTPPKEREKRDSLLCDGDTVDAVLGSVFD